MKIAFFRFSIIIDQIKLFITQVGREEIMKCIWVMKSLSDLVNDTEEYSGEWAKAISISVTERFTVFSMRKWLFGIWDSTNLFDSGGVWGRNVSSLCHNHRQPKLYPTRSPQVCYLVVLVACHTLLTYLYGNQQPHILGECSYQSVLEYRYQERMNSLHCSPLLVSL